MRSRVLMAACSSILVAAIAGCSSTGASVAPASKAPASQAPASAPASAAGSGATVEAKSVGTIGTVLVDGSTGMTVYTFTKDTKDSGKSACAGDCAVKWPALTVATGATPAGGAGVTGALTTITRDDGKVQVVYNGLPLYFFAGDKAVGDSNGVYTNWEAVKP